MTQLRLVETIKPVYASSMKLEEPADEFELVTFGGFHPDYRYEDGSRATGRLIFNRWLWHQIGEPKELMVAFSEAEFVTISRERYERLREALT